MVPWLSCGHGLVDGQGKGNGGERKSKSEGGLKRNEKRKLPIKHKTTLIFRIILK